VKGEVSCAVRSTPTRRRWLRATSPKTVEGVKGVKNDLQVVALRRARPSRRIESRSPGGRDHLGKDPQLKKIDVRTDAGVVVLSGGGTEPSPRRRRPPRWRNRVDA